MNKISEGGVKTSTQAIIGVNNTPEETQFEIGSTKKYNNLLDDDKHIIDIFAIYTYTRSKSVDNCAYIFSVALTK